MRVSAFLVAGIILLGSGGPIYGGDKPSIGKSTEEMKLINEGMDLYKTNHKVEAAVKAWFVGGPLEKSPEASQKIQLFHEIEGVYGLFKTYHVVFVRAPSPMVRVVYLVMEYEKGPVFATFLMFKGEVFKGEVGWVAVRLNFDIDSEKVWPSSLFEEKRIEELSVLIGGISGRIGDLAGSVGGVSKRVEELSKKMDLLSSKIVGQP